MADREENVGKVQHFEGLYFQGPCFLSASVKCTSSVINRPGVAVAVLQTVLLLID